MRTVPSLVNTQKNCTYYAVTKLLVQHLEAETGGSVCMPLLAGKVADGQQCMLTWNMRVVRHHQRKVQQLGIEDASKDQQPW